MATRKTKAGGTGRISLMCNVCVAEFRGDHFDVHGLRQDARKAGWMTNHASQKDYCPVCVKHGHHEAKEYNPPVTT